MSVDEVEREITQPAAIELERGLEDDTAAALTRTAVTTVDDDIRHVLAEGDFRAWKLYLHPTQRKIVEQNYGGPARVSGGPGTDKTIVALHRVARLAAALPPGRSKPILLTTYTKNLTADLRSRLTSLMDPALLGRVDIKHIDQLAQSVLNENTAPGSQRSLITDDRALDVLREVLFEHDEQRWGAEFLFDEWEQIVLGQSLTSRQDYFKARRAGNRLRERPPPHTNYAGTSRITRVQDSGSRPGWCVSLPDAQWARIKPLLPDLAPRRGGRWRDHRQLIDANAFKYRIGMQWMDLPEPFRRPIRVGRDQVP
nr:transposase [Streptomyces halstedii]